MPAPLDLALLTIQGGLDAGAAMVVLLMSVNGIGNAAYAVPGAGPVEGRFARIAELVSRLGGRELFTFATDPHGRLLLNRPRGGRGGDAEVEELVSLLGLAGAHAGRDPLEVPLTLATGAPDGLEVRIETRSIADLIRIAAAAMAVPPEQVASGLAADTPPLALVRPRIRIASGDRPPEDATVSARQHGVWYFIPATGLASKSYFDILENVVSARLADAARRGQSPPTLTLPIARQSRSIPNGTIQDRDSAQF